MLIMGSLAHAGTTQVSPVSNANQTVVVNDNFDSLQTGVNGLQAAYNTLSMTVSSQTTLGVPSGAIVMWSGAYNSVPSGWYVCDGTHGTPDLRGRFVIASDNSSYPVGATGDGTIPAHTHSQQGTTMLRTDTTYFLFDGTADTNTGQYSIGGTTGSYGTGTKNIAVFYALAYIMKS